MGAMESHKLGSLEKINNGYITIPFSPAQQMLRGRKLIFGEREYNKNGFQWHAMILNMLSSRDYNLGLPWVREIRIDVAIANKIFIYIDVVRVLGWCKQ